MYVLAIHTVVSPLSMRLGSCGPTLFSQEVLPGPDKPEEATYEFRLCSHCCLQKESSSNLLALLVVFVVILIDVESLYDLTHLELMSVSALLKFLKCIMQQQLFVCYCY